MCRSQSVLITGFAKLMESVKERPLTLHSSMSSCQYRYVLQNFQNSENPEKHAEVWTLCHFSFGVFQYLKSPFKEVVPGIVVNINIYWSFMPALLIQLFTLAAREMTLYLSDLEQAFSACWFGRCAQSRGSHCMWNCRCAPRTPRRCARGSWSRADSACYATRALWHGREVGPLSGGNLQHVVGKTSRESVWCCVNEEVPACGGMENFSLSIVLLFVLLWNLFGVSCWNRERTLQSLSFPPHFPTTWRNLLPRIYICCLSIILQVQHDVIKRRRCKNWRLLCF